MRVPLRWVSLLLLVLIASCTPRAHTLILWHALEGEHERALLALIDRWNQSASADFVVVPEQRTADLQHRALMQRFEDGRAPDLVLVTPEQMVVYAQRGYLTALEPLIFSADPALGLSAPEREALFPFVLTAGRWNGRLFGIPQGGQMRLVFVNQLRLQEMQNVFDREVSLPITTTVLMEQCAKASDFALGRACFAIAAEAITLEEWALAYGADLPEGTKPALDASAARTALNALLEQVNQFHAVRVRTSLEAEALFAAGDLLFITAWSGRARAIVQRVRSAENFPLLVTVLPSENGTARAPLRAPLWVIPRTDATRQQRAWRFVRWLLEPEQTAEYAARTSELPAHREALPLVAETLLGTPAAPKALAEMLAAAAPLPPRAAQGCIDRVLARALSLSLSSGEVEAQLAETQAELQRLETRYCLGEMLKPSAQTVAR
ncbi:MAG: extracellular solute-binding protein [Thermoflexales bacterium]|nr:extracellular solute-binding protein [Thermoflexales bacterium]